MIFLPYEVELMIFLNNLSPALLKVSQIISDSLYLMVPLIILLVFLKNRKQGIFSVIIIAVSVLVSTILKHLVFEPRPYTVIDKLNMIYTDTPPASSSFPSSHTQTSFTAAVFGKETRYPKYWLGFYIWAALIAASRVILGVHYIHDVLIGALIGYAIGKIFMSKQVSDFLKNIYTTKIK